MISIIVPVFNEEASIERFIFCIKENISNTKAELLLIDGGSSDNTVQICEEAETKVFKAPKKGRAAQMNFGASKASGDILYFLHADSLPPSSFIKDIYENIDKGYSAGCYKLSFDSEHYLLKLYTWFTQFDVTLFRFGDQSLFITKKVFSKINGFDESLQVMEDQQIVREIKKENKFVIISKSVVTSSRKYDQVGPMRLQFIFALIVCLYYLGVSQKVMIDFYSNQLK